MLVGEQRDSIYYEWTSKESIHCEWTSKEIVFTASGRAKRLYSLRVDEQRDYIVHEWTRKRSIHYAWTSKDKIHYEWTSKDSIHYQWTSKEMRFTTSWLNLSNFNPGAIWLETIVSKAIIGETSPFPCLSISIYTRFNDPARLSLVKLGKSWVQMNKFSKMNNS